MKAPHWWPPSLILRVGSAYEFHRDQSLCSLVGFPDWTEYPRAPILVPLPGTRLGRYSIGDMRRTRGFPELRTPCSGFLHV